MLSELCYIYKPIPDVYEYLKDKNHVLENFLFWMTNIEPGADKVVNFFFLSGYRISGWEKN